MKLKLTRKTGTGDTKKRKVIRMRLTSLSEQQRRTELASDAAAAKTPAFKRSSENLILNSAKLAKSDGTLSTGRPAGVLAKGPSPEEQLKEKRKWKARSFSGRHLPVLQCNNCSLSRVCSKFRAGYECAFLPYLSSHKVESVADLSKYMKELVGNSMRRAQLMNIIETANGGMPSLETSEALDMAFRQLKDLHGVLADGTEDVLEIEGDASVVGAIFGGMKLEKLRAETETMHRADPILDLPLVAQTETPAALQPMEDNVAQDLLRDAILNQTGSGQGKKDLRSLPEISIEVSEVNKHP